MNIDIPKPISLVRADFISALTNLVNNSNLPPFIIEPILKDLYSDIHILSQKQLENDTKYYKEE